MAALGADVVISAKPRFAGSPSARVDGRNVLSLYLDRGKRGSEEAGEVDVVLNATLDTPRDPDRSRQIRVGFSDFGATGPLGSWKASELVAQASTGLMHITGEVGGPPLALGGHQIDYGMGLQAFSAVMIALWERDGPDGSGEGQDIALSRFETGTYLEWKGRIYSQVNNPLRRGKVGGPLIIRVRDGYFGLWFERNQWSALVEYFDDDRLRESRFATRDSRDEHEPALREIFEELLRGRTRDDLYASFQAMNMPVAPILTVEEVLGSPQYLHRGFIVDNPVAGASAREPGMPVTFNLVRPGSSRSDNPDDAFGKVVHP